MIDEMISLFFGCRHRRITRPITPVHKRTQAAGTYVACLDCGKQFHYDVDQMRIGKQLTHTPGPDTQFQTSQ